MSLWESISKIFNLFSRQKSYEELTVELDDKMQDLYTRMGWQPQKINDRLEKTINWTLKNDRWL